MNKHELMSWKEWASLDATAMAELVKKGEVSAKELAAQAARATELINPKLNAVIEVYDDVIADPYKDGMNPDGPFHGVPYFLKDLGPTQAGRKCEGGSRLTEGFVADHDSYLTARFKQAGLNNLGRTACPELGLTFSTESVVQGVSRNPWNLERTPGGSSGGSAAIVAAGVVPIAHANDGGGSIRIPASINGLVGLKCSRGRVSQGPDAGDVLFPLFSDLVVSRSVRDTAAILDATCGPMPGESTMYQYPQRPFLEEVGRPAGTLRIALATRFGDCAAAADVKMEIERVGNLLQDMGHDVTEATPKINFEEFLQVFSESFCVLAPAMLDGMAQSMGREISADTLEPVTLRTYERGKELGMDGYVRVLEKMNQVSRQLGEFFTSYDLLLTPTLAIPVPNTGVYHLNRDISVDQYFEEIWAAIPYTPLNNFTGTPAISLPLCHTDDGMPLGAHFMAPMGAEARLLRLAAALENAAPWHDKKPAIHVSAL